MSQNSPWPLPKFYFQVDFGTVKSLSFQEISGLESGTQLIEYRHSDTQVFSTIKMPGLSSVGTVTMKKGVFVNDISFWQWMNAVEMNVAQTQTVIISLLDETGTVKCTWTLQNAWPIMITGTDTEDNGNEVAVGTIQIAYEQQTISNHG